jgi:hypothetical protein
MSFIIELHWQHLIILLGIIAGPGMFSGYKKDDDRYGFEILIRLFFGIIIFLIFLCLYFGLGYYGAFK